MYEQNIATSEQKKILYLSTYVLFCGEFSSYNYHKAGYFGKLTLKTISVLEISHELMRSNR